MTTVIWTANGRRQATHQRTDAETVSAAGVIGPGAKYFAVIHAKQPNQAGLRWHLLCSDPGMQVFFRRFIGALALNPGAFEDIEAARDADIESVLVVLAVCLAGGMGAIGAGAVGVSGFVTGAVMVLGAWLVWVGVIATVGTVTFPEAQTSSNARELLRVLGYAAAPGVFLAFAAMRTAAPIVVLIVAAWMIAAAVIAVRQALDYRHTGRAVAVCGIAWLVSFGTMTAVALIFSRRVG